MLFRGRSTPSIGEDLNGLINNGLDCALWRLGDDGFGKGLIARSNAEGRRMILEYSFNLCLAVFGSNGSGGGAGCSAGGQKSTAQRDEFQHDGWLIS